MLIAGLLLMLLVVPAAQAAFPGQNGKIAFYNTASPAGVWVMSPDGSGQTHLRDGREPAWSPDGAQIAFSRREPPPPDMQIGYSVYKMPSDGSSETAYVQAQPYPLDSTYSDSWGEPTWSPNGSTLAMTLYQCGEGGGTTGCYYHPVAGGPFATRGLGTSTSWRPDGAEIAYVRHDYYSRPIGIGAVRPDGTGQRVIWQEGGSDCLDVDTYCWGASHPDFSSAGERVVFSTTYPEGADEELFSIDTAGGTPVRLTNNSSYDSQAVWSPDGSKIAFVSDRDGNREIYTMNTDGTNQTRITNDPATQSDPSWQPLPGYVRPASATPLRIPLVPAFQSCASPNRAHGSPLAYGSCAPPVHASGHVTVGTASSGFVKIRVRPGAPGPPSDTDVPITFNVTDVRCKAGTSTCGSANSTGGADYTGELQARATIRLTDRNNGPTSTSGGTDPATVVDIPMPINATCGSTASTSVGATCTTTAGPLIPDPCSCEGKRMVVEFSDFRVRDGGADGLISTDPNTLFLRQGLFVP